MGGAAPTAHLIEELERIGIDLVHIYGLTYVLPRSFEIFIHNESAEKSVLKSTNGNKTLILRQTYGPYTRNFEQPSWVNLSLNERARLIARQGHPLATVDEVRVVYASKTDDAGRLEDVPRDGKTMGEVVMRGNIVMKEVVCSFFFFSLTY